MAEAVPVSVDRQPCADRAKETRNTQGLQELYWLNIARVIIDKTWKIKQAASNSECFIKN